jgi:uncharacterized membrane protein (UPF0136 family)
VEKENRSQSMGLEFIGVFGGFEARVAEMSMNANTSLWIYIVLLLVGGLIGFLKAGSKVSLITSAVSAAVLIVTTIPGLFGRAMANGLVYFILATLLVVFAVRLTKTKKFMPSGLMLVLTLAALVLRKFGS